MAADDDGDAGPAAQERPGDVDLMMTVLQRLTSVADATLRTIGATLVEFGLTMSTAGLLWALDPRAEPPTLRSLARQLGCDPSTVTLMADKLQEGGLVERRPHPTDGRKRTLALTEQGMALWDRFSRQLSQASVLAVLTPAELATLDTLLEKASTGCGAGSGQRGQQR